MYEIIEWRIRVPWPNRRRPFIALIVTKWGTHIQHRISRDVLRVLIVWGRLFTDYPLPTFGRRTCNFEIELPPWWRLRWDK
jgi:hypothetical protein